MREKCYYITNYDNFKVNNHNNVMVIDLLQMFVIAGLMKKIREKMLIYD